MFESHLFGTSKRKKIPHPILIFFYKICFLYISVHEKSRWDVHEKSRSDEHEYFRIVKTPYIEWEWGIPLKYRVFSDSFTRHGYL